MTLEDHSRYVLSSLSVARQIADYAERLGVLNRAGRYHVASNHLGAALADCILQAGVNYETVVRTRVERIIVQFPEAATMVGTVKFVEQGAVSEFLMWKHSEKISRFSRLVIFLQNYSIEDTNSLHAWLQRRDHRDQLLELSGIGPKSVDYLSGLVGIDCIAVDRHIKRFANNAGVAIANYEELKLAVTYAADLLGVSRRDFDSWIWQSQRLNDSSQGPLL